jgi:hypothetical protein
MKKFIAISFAFIYLFLSTGLVINVHYCKEKIKSVSVYTAAESCCTGTCEMKHNCCKDKQFIVQLEPQDKTIPVPPDLSVYYNLVSEEIDLVLIPNTTSDNIVEFSYDLPPPKLLLWKKNCSFLYYG